jgi:2-hydroxychromene-2-carboxylate isomerase
MTEAIDAYYWMQSDWAYFGNPRLKAMAKRYDLAINHRPVDLATVYARTGGIKLPYRSKERKNYRLIEMRRFSRILGMPINLEPKFGPVTGHLPSWFVIAAEKQGHDVHDLCHSIMTGLWVEDLDIEDPQVLVQMAEKNGLDGGKILAQAQDPKTELVYMAYTNEAISRGVWGAPFYFFRNEPFWGQDRLEMLEDTIAAVISPRSS